MKKADFERLYAKIADEVRSQREVNNYDDNNIRCWLIGYMTNGNYSYTSAQLRKVFDLGFGDKKPLEPGSNQGQRNNISHSYYKGESGGNQDE